MKSGGKDQGSWKDQEQLATHDFAHASVAAPWERFWHTRATPGGWASGVVQIGLKYEDVPWLPHVQMYSHGAEGLRKAGFKVRGSLPAHPMRVGRRGGF